MIYLGADHRGFSLKEEIKKYLEEKKKEYKDEGAFKKDVNDDYTLYAEKVGSLVAYEKEARGILICGSGVGVDVVANKIDGVRASIGKSAAQVKKGREDDNMNILVLAADFTGKEEAKKMVGVFLETKFSGKERHKRRLAEIARLESNN